MTQTVCWSVLVAACHLTAHALIIQKDDIIDAFASVQDSCGSQTPRIKQTMKQKSFLPINTFMADG